MMDACPEANRRIPQALKICQIITLNNDATISGFHCPVGTVIFCRKTMPAKNMNKAAIGAIKPRKVQGGISSRPIFKNGHEVPQPNIMTISKKYPVFVRPVFSIFHKIMAKKTGVSSAGHFK